MNTKKKKKIEQLPDNHLYKTKFTSFISALINTL